VVTEESPNEQPPTWRRAWQFVAARFDPQSHLGLGLTIRLALFALAIWAFSGLLDAVLGNRTLVRIDRTVEAWFHLHATPAGLKTFNIITQLGSPVVNVLIGVVAIYLLYKRQYPLLVTWLAANLGGKVIEFIIKNTVHRTRPAFGADVLRTVSYSFPSGHTMASTICYLMLAYMIATKPGMSRPIRYVAYGLGILIVTTVAFSRLYLQVHYPTDVMGGFAAGFAWLSACGVTRHLFTAGQTYRG
jgi:undecaprenyl-diphosphatase